MTVHTKELIGLLKDFKNEVINKLNSPYFGGIKAQKIIKDTFTEYKIAIEKRGGLK